MSATERLAGCRILVTGGSLGIGAATAHTLARRGASVLLMARRREQLETTLAQLPGRGHEAHALDVSDERAWGGAASLLTALDGLVCAAGVLNPVGPIGSYEPAAFWRTLQINVLGTLLAIHHCLPALRASRGSIVTFSGGGGTSPLPRYDAYATSKAAVARLTENLATELDPSGVRINCVAPGFVATGMHDTTLSAGPELAGADYFHRTETQLQAGGVPAGEAAELVTLLLDRGDPVSFSGKLISAQWDPWREEAFRQRLEADADLATLRRIDDVLFTRGPGAPGT